MKTLWERSFPYALALIAAVLYLAWAPAPEAMSTRLNADTREIFSSTFDFATVLTGLLFAIFILALVPGGGFLAKIFSTETFRIFRRYVIEALILGSASTVLSWPLRAVRAYPEDASLEWTLIVAVWLFVSLAAVLAFVRVAYIFFVFESAGRLNRR